MRESLYWGIRFYLYYVPKHQYKFSCNMQGAADETTPFSKLVALPMPLSFLQSLFISCNGWFALDP